MAKYGKWATVTAASVLMLGSLIVAAPSADATSSSGMSPRGGNSGNPRTEADVAEKGARVSKPVSELPMMGKSDSSTMSGSGSMSGGSMSDGKMHSGKMHHGTHRMGRHEVMGAQKALNDNGASIKVDGKMGPNTRRALMNYQAKNGLTVTGKLDPETASSLGM